MIKSNCNQKLQRRVQFILRMQRQLNRGSQVAGYELYKAGSLEHQMWIGKGVQETRHESTWPAQTTNTGSQKQKATILNQVEC